MKKLKPITSVDELLKFDESYPAFTPALLGYGSPLTKLSRWFTGVVRFCFF